MHIGRFDRAITITSNYEAGYTQDDFGGLTVKTIESTPVSWWAELKQDQGGEDIKGGKVTTAQTVLFIMRYTSAITVHSRITYDSDTYIVESFREVYGRKRFLEVKTRLIDGGV